MDKNYRSLSPFGKAVAHASGAMQILHEAPEVLGVTLLAEAYGPRILNRYAKVEMKADPRLLGSALADLMISDYRFREAVTYALSDYKGKKGRNVRGDRT